MKSITKTMEGSIAWLRKNLLLFLTFTGVLSGFVFGTSLRSFDLSQETILLIAYPGELFMRLLKLMILPLIIASLITGAASLNAKMNGMIALRTIVYFIITSLLSACVGLVLVIIIHPGNPEVKTLLGSGENFILLMFMKTESYLGTTAERKIDIVENFLDLGRNLIPDNLFRAAFETVRKKKHLYPINLCMYLLTCRPVQSIPLMQRWARFSATGILYWSLCLL